MPAPEPSFLDLLLKRDPRGFAGNIPKQDEIGPAPPIPQMHEGAQPQAQQDRRSLGQFLNLASLLMGSRIPGMPAPGALDDTLISASPGMAPLAGDDLLTASAANRLPRFSNRMPAGDAPYRPSLEPPPAPTGSGAMSSGSLEPIRGESLMASGSFPGRGSKAFDTLGGAPGKNDMVIGILLGGAGAAAGGELGKQLGELQNEHKQTATSTAGYKAKPRY